MVLNEQDVGIRGDEDAAGAGAGSPGTTAVLRKVSNPSKSGTGLSKNSCRGVFVPITVVETLSAFANTPGGGVLLLGVDESEGFAPTGVSDPGKIQQDLGSVARDGVTPPLQPKITVQVVEGRHIVVAEVPELPREEKPCFVTRKGMTHGSFLPFRCLRPGRWCL
jgi:predicted HTH transcriptional regulator